MPDTVNVRIDFEDRKRTYVLHKPAPADAVPQIIMACHGTSAGGEGLWTNEWQARWSDKGIWLAFPDSEDHGGKPKWINYGHAADVDYLGVDEHADERFLLAVQADVNAKAAAQGFGTPRDWYLCGFSDGARMTEHMYMFQPGAFRAFGINSKSLTEGMAALIPPVEKSTIFVCGTADDNQWPVDAGDHIGAEATAEWFRSRHGCAANYTEVIKSGNIATSYIRTFNACTTATRFIKVDGGAHSWFRKPATGFGAMRSSCVSSNSLKDCVIRIVKSKISWSVGPGLRTESGQASGNGSARGCPFYDGLDLLPIQLRRTRRFFWSCGRAFDNRLPVSAGSALQCRQTLGRNSCMCPPPIL